MATVVRVAIVFVVIWASFRVLGKRELSRMSPLELVFLLFIPQLFSRALTRQDYSMTNAIIGSCTMLALVYLSSSLTFRVKAIGKVLVPRPTVLVENGRFIARTMDEERLTTQDVYDAIQKAGLASVREVRWAVLQADGAIGIIPVDPQRAPIPKQAIEHGQ